jgi:hypothetical protein
MDIQLFDAVEYLTLHRLSKLRAQRKYSTKRRRRDVSTPDLCLIGPEFDCRREGHLCRKFPVVLFLGESSSTFKQAEQSPSTSKLVIHYHLCNLRNSVV